ncbi:MAG: hypothetical protein R2828_35755 [Saprospiraceae bacterium]
MNWFKTLLGVKRKSTQKVKVTSLEEFIGSLKNSKSPRTQMDVFYEEQIVMQVYNQYDVKNWDMELPETLYKEGGILVELSFNKNKRNNKANLERFKEAHFFSEFVLFEEGITESYFLPISSLVSDKAIERKISEIIYSVYNLEKSDQLDVLVRSF